MSDLATRLAVFFEAAAEESFDGNDMGGDYVQSLGLRLGLLRKGQYDPAIHGNTQVDVAEGDEWFVIADDVRAAAKRSV